MNVISTQTERNLQIEVLVDGKWVASNRSPDPYSAMDSPQSVPSTVWVAYLRYLQAREVYADNPTEFRLVTWTYTTTKEPYCE